MFFQQLLVQRERFAPIVVHPGHPVGFSKLVLFGGSRECMESESNQKQSRQKKA
jgi:hypothetical protein